MIVANNNFYHAIFNQQPYIQYNILLWIFYIPLYTFDIKDLKIIKC